MKYGFEGLRKCGSAAFEMEKYLSTAAGRKWLSWMQHYFFYDDEMAPEVLEYWRSYGLGLDKYLHEADDPKHKWSIFVPLSARADKERRYPAVISLHGGGDSVYRTENFGYAHLAAEKEFICIVPEDESAPGIRRVVEIAVRDYPVDPERIYCTGFSYGGGMTTQNGILNCELFAGAHVIGTVHPGIATSEEHIEEVLPGIRKNSAMLDEYAAMAAALPRATELRMPIVHTGGMAEVRMPFPLSKDPTGPEGGFNAVDKMSGIQTWSDINGCRRIESALTSEDEVERQVGIKLDRTEKRNILNLDCWIGELLDKDGVAMMRFVGEDMVPHCPSAVNAELGWEFLSRFSRDSKTHELRVEK